MNVTQVLLARAARYVRYPHPLYLPDVIKLLWERYHFVQVPTTSDQILPTAENSGILRGFLHGKLEHEGRTILVQSVTFYSDAVAIESPISTDDADIVLDDLLSQAANRMIEPTDKRVYASSLELTLEVPLEGMYPMATAIEQVLTQSSIGYGNDQAPAFRLSSLKVSTDPTRGIVEEFQIERRANAAFEANLYFSQATLSTQHHIALLETFEARIRDELRGSSASPSEPQPPSSQSGSASED